MNNKTIVGFCGPKRSGKNEAGLALSNLGWYKHEMSCLMRTAMEYSLGKTFTDEEYEFTKDEILLGDRTYRDFYLGIGKMLRTEFGRFVLSDHMMRVYDESEVSVYVPNARMPTEALAIKERGGVIIEILHEMVDYDESEETEKRLPYSLIDCSVLNNGTKKDLHDEILHRLML